MLIEALPPSRRGKATAASGSFEHVCKHELSMRVLVSHLAMPAAQTSWPQTIQNQDVGLGQNSTPRRSSKIYVSFVAWNFANVIERPLSNDFRAMAMSLTIDLETLPVLIVPGKHRMLLKDVKSFQVCSSIPDKSDLQCRANLRCKDLQNVRIQASNNQKDWQKSRTQQS